MKSLRARPESEPRSQSVSAFLLVLHSIGRKIWDEIGKNLVKTSRDNEQQQKYDIVSWISKQKNGLKINDYQPIEFQPYSGHLWEQITGEKNQVNRLSQEYSNNIENPVWRLEMKRSESTENHVSPLLPVHYEAKTSRNPEMKIHQNFLKSQ